MKDFKNTDKLSDREWEALASHYSGENNSNSAILNDSELAKTEKLWQELRNTDNAKIDVDKAWNRVNARIADNEITTVRTISFRPVFLKVAAAVTLLIALGSLVMLVSETGPFNNNIAFVTSADESNLRIDLPDGSTVILNRNSRLSYEPDFGNKKRDVRLSGEAFFDIAPDASKPFVIDAGKALVEVVGTSFNVITENTDSEVEVFVETGKVVIEEKSGSKSLMLEPGDVGRISELGAEKTVNKDQNYMAWNTGRLVYKGEKLEVVFNDLKKVYNLNIVADDPAIYQLPWTAPIEYQPAENIIRMICLSFGLSYEKDGDVYHLTEK